MLKIKRKNKNKVSELMKKFNNSKKVDQLRLDDVLSRVDDYSEPVGKIEFYIDLLKNGEPKFLLVGRNKGDKVLIDKIIDTNNKMVLNGRITIRNTFLGL